MLYVLAMMLNNFPQQFNPWRDINHRQNQHRNLKLFILTFKMQVVNKN